MDPDDVLLAADANFRSLFEALASVLASSTHREEDGLVLIATGIPVGSFNPTFATGPVADPGAAVRAVGRHYEGLGLPHEIVFRDEVAPGLAEACAAAGLVERNQMPLMVLDPVPPAGTASSTSPTDLEVEVVYAGNLRDYGDVLSAAFGMPREMVEPLCRCMLEIEGLTGFLGRVAAEPVATSAVFVAAGVAGVYNVAVPEAHRRRGLGEALTAVAARHGSVAGVTTAVLQASKLGEPVYRRMGYEVRAWYRQFEPAPA